ncbi:MAG: 50S ribosomal protein L6 [Candidatus Aenigmatarchaeota archaeon]
MEKIVAIPDNVQIEIKGLQVTVKGNGELSRDFGDPRLNGLIKIEKKDSMIHVSDVERNRTTGANVGTIAAHIKNMIIGVTVGFMYTMKIMYTHFPLTVVINGNEIQIKNFFGEKGSRTAKIVGKTDVKVDKDTVTITGINVEEVSQTAANIESACKLTGRDRRIFQDGIFITGRYLKTGEAV